MLRKTALWGPFSRFLQRSGLKARICSRSIIPPVKTVNAEEVYAMLCLTQKPHQEPAEFCPPIPINSGPMPPEDAEFFVRFVAALAPKAVFEFGTNWGISTACIALNTPPSARIQTLDVCREMFSEAHLQSDPELQMVLLREHAGWQYRKQPELAEKIEQLFADSMTFDMAKQAPGGEAHDLIFIDACHAYEFVKKDTENALKSVKRGGCLIWHDFYPDVSSWTGVFLAVSEFAREHPGVVHVRGTHFAIWMRPMHAA